MQMYSPCLHVFHPSDCVSERDVLPLSSKSLIVMYYVGLVMHPDPDQGDGTKKQLNYLKENELELKCKEQDQNLHAFATGVCIKTRN